MTGQDLRQTLEDVLVNLRQDDALVAALSKANGLTEGYASDPYGDNYGGLDVDARNAIRLMHESTDPFEPYDGASFDVVVAVGVVTDNTTPRNTARTKTWRIQAEVACKLDWRDEMDASPGTFATLELASILGRVSDRLDIASSIPAAIPEGAAGSPIPLEDEENGTLSMVQQWLIQHTQTHRAH